MSKFLRIACLVLTVLALFYSPAHAARLYFTTDGAIPGGGDPVGAVPSLTFDNIGDTRDLYVWVDLEDNSWMAGYGLDIRATTPGIVEATTSTFYNSEVRAPAFGNSVVGSRWNAATVRNGTVNPNGSGTALLVEDARGFDVNLAGAAGIAYDGNGIKQGQALPTPLLDQQYDATNGVFLAQRITLRALANGSTGLAMHVGSNAFSVDNSTTTVPIFFGAGTTGVPNNAVGQTDGTMHANIQVGGIGPVGPTLVVLENPTGSIVGDVVFNASPAGTDLDAGGRTSGRITIVDYIGQPDGALPLFFDLVPGANAQQLVTDLNAIAGRPFTAALSTAPLSVGTADLVLNFANRPAGSDLFVDFDFGVGNGVARIGIPEPSTLTLAGMSLFGLVGVAIRRRRAAKA